MRQPSSERASYACETCSFSLWLPIAELRASTLGLYDDARFPGRCLLVFHRHEEDFASLAPNDVREFMADLQLASRAIALVTKPARMNYALLGNREPHVHFHLIPRPITDPVPDRTPWHHPEPRRDLDPAARDALIHEIAERVTRRSS
jgi:diadenosine tetraphosphate (Ap4A) HIT family hydrolase